MSDSVALDLQFSQAFFWHDPSKSTDNRPLFLATNGVHGVVNVDYSAGSPASHSTDVIKLCLYGMLIRSSTIDGLYL